MRFFDTNVIARYQGGTMIGSSGNYETAFSETIEYSFQSDGQDTDGNIVTLERVFTGETDFDALVILATNFKNEIIWIKETGGGAYIDITSEATKTTSADGLSFIYKWPTKKTFFSLKVSVPDTIVADEEKDCGCILAFEEIGDLVVFSSVQPTKRYQQKKLTLDTGGVVMVSKGSHWAFKIVSKLINSQDQADIIANIQGLGREFFIWINSGLETAKIEAEPYRFNDFIKCVHTGKPKPKFYKNYLNSLLEDGIDFEQTGQLK